jgi:hypothetical protein
MVEAVPEQSLTDAANELDEARWAVISFDRREGSALTYPQAVKLLDELDSRRIAGLAIVSDEAAAHIND